MYNNLLFLLHTFSENLPWILKVGSDGSNLSSIFASLNRIIIGRLAGALVLIHLFSSFFHNIRNHLHSWCISKATTIIIIPSQVDIVKTKSSHTHCVPWFLVYVHYCGHRAASASPPTLCQRCNLIPIFHNVRLIRQVSCVSHRAACVLNAVSQLGWSPSLFMEPLKG